MKKITLCLLVCCATLVSQVRAAESLWMTDFSAAQTKSKAENKPLLMDFTGSDWCPPCMQLHKTVLSTPEFENYAKTNLVLLVVDFPRSKPLSKEQKEANQVLQKKYKIEGYPTVIVLDSAGKELDRQVGYGGESASEYVAKLQKIKTQ